MKPTPLLSIIIPSYNQASFIRQCLQSLICKTPDKLEVIVMDGGSTDATAAVIDSFKPMVNVFRSEPDKGQADALRNGVFLASGHFIGWQNSDDFYQPGTIDTILDILSASPLTESTDIFFGNLDLVDETGRTFYKQFYTAFSATYLRYVGWNISNQSCFFRRSVLLKTDVLDISLQYAVDFDLFNRLIEAKARFRHVPQLTGAFRIHKNAKGSSMQLRRAAEYQELRKRYVPGYSPYQSFSNQFRLRRFMAYFYHALLLLFSNQLTKVINQKLFHSREATVIMTQRI